MPRRIISIFVVVAFLCVQTSFSKAEEEQRVGLTEKAARIVAQIQNEPDWKKKGKLITDLAAILLSLIPPLGAATDKVGERFFTPDLNGKIGQLAEIINLMAPEIEKIENIEARLGAILVLLKENKALLIRLNEICREYNESAPKEFHVRTDNSLQEFINVTVKDMNVRIEAHNNGRNILYRFNTSGGDVQFYSTTGGYQRVYDSEFRGDNNGVIKMHKMGVSGPIRTYDDDKGTGIGFGSNGMLAFEQGSFIGFGRKKDEKTE